MSFLHENPGTKKQILSLGAGFDTSYFRLYEKGMLVDTKYFEVRVKII